MTHTEALTMAYHYIDNVDYGPYNSKPVLDAIKEALAQPQQEPVAWMDREGDLYKMPEIKNWAPPHTMLYTTPPQRLWQGLTDEEITELDMEISGRTMDECVQAIEAKLKERNI